MAEDWDNLIILDGCRYDFFKRVNDIEGDLTSIISQGSHSTEFLNETFAGKTFHDTIYITSNPHAPNLIDDEFFKMETLYGKNRSDPPREHYPDNVIQMSTPVFEEYPDKRYIIHFMQPNVPFLGPTAQEVRKRLLEEQGIVFSGVTELQENAEPTKELGTLKQACEEGFITRETLLEAYEENVEIAIKYAKQLMEEVDGKTVITADHGEMLGERVPPFVSKKFGHDPGLYTEELRKVPWLVIDSDERREVRSEKPVERERVDDEVVKDRLEKLGYADYT